jgi:PAS domain S-box-containing protein
MSAQKISEHTGKRESRSQTPAAEYSEAEAALFELASRFLLNSKPARFAPPSTTGEATIPDDSLPTAADRFRVLVEQIPAVVFMVFLDGGLSEAYVSPQIEQMLGFRQDEWLDDPIRWYGQIHPEDKQRWSLDAAQLLLTGNPLRATYRVLSRENRVVWFRCEAKLVRRSTGEPWFVHGVGFDVTELKETELALQRETAERERLQKLELERQIAKTEATESMLAAIVESSEDPIISKTLDGTITSWNAAAARLFGYEAEEILGKSILMLVPADLQQEEQEILRKLGAGEWITHQQSRRLTKAGATVEVSLTISPVKDASGHVIGASTIARDITERKRAQAALLRAEKLAAAGRLAATIAHEINNPLEAVTNLLFLLRSEPALSENGRKFLETAEQELTRVSHIARQTLGFYRESAGPATCRIAAQIDEAFAIYGKRLAEKNVHFSREYEAPLEVKCYPGELRQVLSNLISNAIDATADGTIRVRARRSRSANTHRQGVRITVADSGHGIPARVVSHIFEPFFTTKKDVGTGLGLWVCQNIIAKHGGWIRVRSSNGAERHGTVFSLFLPDLSSSTPAEHAAAMPAAVKHLAS